MSLIPLMALPLFVAYLDSIATLCPVYYFILVVAVDSGASDARYANYNTNVCMPTN